MQKWFLCAYLFSLLICPKYIQHTKDKHIETTHPLTHLPSQNKRTEQIYKEKPAKETNTITVMCLHHCLIIKDDDKRIQCHSEDSGYLGAVSNMRSTKQRKRAKWKTQGKQPGLLPARGAEGLQKYWGDKQ